MEALGGGMRVGLFVGVLLLGLASAARAQESGATHVASAGDRTEEAKGLFSAGRAAFEAGRYADALGHFERSYAISGRPALLYNIGVAADRLRADAQALDAYERYLREVPDAENQAEVEKRVAALREARERQRASATPVPAVVARPPGPPPAPPPTPEATAEPAPPASSPLPVEPSAPAETDGISTLQWAAVGTSGAMVIGGGVLLGLALSDKGKVESAQDGTAFADFESAHDRVPTFSTVGGVLLGVGIAGVAASVVWILIDDEAESEPGMALHLGPRGVQLAGAFR